MSRRHIILAFDTSNEVIAIGLGVPDVSSRTVTCLAQASIPARRASNTQLLVRIDELLQAHDVEREDISCVACGRGPGSFTGVRICMATAKGAAEALEVPLVGVSTLDAIAWGLQLAGLRGEALVVADAMRREVYPVRYNLTEADIVRCNADVVVKAADQAEKLPASDALLVAGDALGKYAELFAHAGTFVGEELWTVQGSGLLAALQDAWRQGLIDPFDAIRHNPAYLLPVYTRLSDAEENERTRFAHPVPRDLRTGVQASRIEYRPLDATQTDRVAQLEAQIMGSDAWTSALVADELGRKDRTWWAAVDNTTSQLVGYAGGWVIDGELQILKVGCDPAWRRMGIARMLLGRVAADARDLGARTASLEVRVSNAGAQEFYRVLGFESKGRRPRYYSNREDALVLTGPLPLVDGDVAGMQLRINEAAWGTNLSEETVSQAACELDSVAEDPMPSMKNTVIQPLILAIESSCDETAAAVVDGADVILADTVASQIDFHSRFGGVVPEIASRKHVEAICGVTQVCLERAAARMGAGRVRWRDLDAVAVTYAPGLVGALVVGVAFAKGAAWAAGIPCIGVNHLEGHLYANKLARNDMQPPMVVSLVSGGNTMLVHVKDWGDYEVLGETIDDAVGEAFDKVAKALGLGYPGGPVISKHAAQGNPAAIPFPRAMMHSGDLRFSFSGLKTAVIGYIRERESAGDELNIPDICASFQAAVIDVQVAKACTALEMTGAKEFCLGGGVAANRELREAYERACAKRGVRLTMPPMSACTDNAAMIALVAIDRYRQGKFFGLDADAQAHVNLEEPY